ncbi:MAG: glycosyltransferase family 4 protein [Balneolaceae bacterium]|nr:glycosyltransferase family 4 protein [Balneolaceae bacterium]MCH8550036.1 glycosyltransferase family 4 protein [Balneolaceae bacterium]
MTQKVKTLLIIGTVWPEPASSAAGSRMIQLLRLFASAGYRITFVSAAADSEFAADLSTYGVDKESVKLNDSSFDQFVKELNPDLVIFDRFMTEEQFGWRVAEQCPDALRVLDTEDLHCLRRARRTAYKAQREFIEKDLLKEEVALREIASIYRCDLTLMISQEEIRMLKELFGINEKLLHYMPFMLDEDELPVLEEIKPFDQREGFCTIGNFRHPPNYDSVLLLKEIVWPLVRKRLPDAVLNIWGSYPSQKVMQLHDPKSGFLIRGRAESADEAISSAKVLIAPLRFGAGLKGKIVDAMKTGTPVVTTPVGAEGYNWDEYSPGLVDEDMERFADAAVKLSEEKNFWQKASLEGVRYVRDHFSAELYEGLMLDKLEAIIEDRDRHRVENFTGRMLMHHSLASTRYMSRWIEEKEKSRKLR